jgi:hypothetical protein
MYDAAQVVRGVLSLAQSALISGPGPEFHFRFHLLY